MAQEIYNEGRVVGFSAWELFAKEALANGVPREKIPSETQWLTSMVGSGASMILKIPTGTVAGNFDFDLPQGSNLTAAGVIVATPFFGDCAWNDNTPNIPVWATKVTSYSPLIKNESGAGNYPTSSSVPSGTYDSSEYADMVEEFVKITDGIVYTKGANWKNAASNPPEKDIDPNFNESTTAVRFYISSAVTTDIKILLTGFANKRILQAVSGYASGSGGGSTDVVNNDWVNGGMLGPEVIPWASKIILSVPNSAFTSGNHLTRTIPSDTTYTEKTVGGIQFKGVNHKVKTNSLIDFDGINITDYYIAHSSDFTGIPTLEENVSVAPMGSADNYNSLIAWYPGMTAAKIESATDISAIFPPALYATQVSTTGEQTLVPMDTAAPGTVKAFETSTQATNYLNQMPDNYAIYHNPTSDTYSFAKKNEPDSTKWTGTATLEYLTAPKAKITAGNNSAKFIALTNSSGTDYNTAGTGATPVSVGPTNNLTWDNLLTALTSNKSVDVLGTKLHNLGTELTSANTIGKINSVTEIGANTLTITGSNPASMTTSVTNTTTLITAESGTSFKAGTNFIEFSNGKRLYIDTSAPATTNVPIGSIGIGW